MGAQSSQLSFENQNEGYKEFNWIPSLGENTTIEIINDEETYNKLYIDHRDKIPIIEDNDLEHLQVVKVVCCAINFSLLNSNKVAPFRPSYKYIYYYLSRYKGLHNRHSFKEIESVITKFGLSNKNDYDQLIDVTKPSDEIYNKSLPYRHLKFNFIKPDDIKKILINGDSVLLGMGIYNNFMDTRNSNTLSTPDEKDEIIGGFCGLIVGFIEKDKKYIVMTVKGKSWGDNGFIFIPYDMLFLTSVELCYISLMDDMIKLEIDIMNKKVKNKYSNFI